MTDETEETAAITPPAAYSFVTNLLAIVADAKACGVRLRSLQEREAAAVKAEASLAPAKAQHDVEFAQTRAALDKREAELHERNLALLAKEAGIEQRHRELRELHKEIRESEDRLKRRLLYHAGHVVNEKLQSVPVWEEVDRICFGTPDPHFDQQQQTREGAGESVTEPAPDSPTDRPALMRGVPASRSATARRAERRAAEGHSHT